jgi:hypothetical protein
VPNSVFFDTQIVISASDGSFTGGDWNRFIQRVTAKYQYKVSVNTLLELLNALEGGDERNFERNRARILTAADIDGSEFLPLPGQFLRNSILKLPLDREDFSPSILKSRWMPIIKNAKSKQQLTTGVNCSDFEGLINLGMVKQQIKIGQRLWVQELQLAKDGEKKLPSKSLYAEFILQFDVRAEATPERTAALEAAVSIHRQSRWLYGCWPLKGAFSQPSEAKARTKAKASYCCLHCRSSGNWRENILPEFSKFYCHPGRAGGSPFWIRSAFAIAKATCRYES